MKKEILDAQIKEEVNHIAKDIKGSLQNALRGNYTIQRRERMDLPKEVVLKACIESEKKQNSNFKPQFDNKFFKMEKLE